jgi:hypothetical protein
MNPIVILIFCTALVSNICAQLSEPQRSASRDTTKREIEKNDLKCSLRCTEAEVFEGKPAQLILKVRNVGKTDKNYHITDCCGPTIKIIASFRNGQVLNFADLQQQEHHPHPVTHWIELPPDGMNEHEYNLRINQFLKEDYLFIDPELGAPLYQYGKLSLRIVVNNVESNIVEITVRGKKP